MTNGVPHVTGGLGLALSAVRRRVRATALGGRLADYRYILRHRDERDFYGAFIHPGSLVFDIGANTGLKAVIFHSLGAQVVCAEPYPPACRELRRRFAHTRRVSIEEVAVGAACGSADMMVAPASTLISTLAIAGAARGRFRDDFVAAKHMAVAVSTLDSLIARHGMPDFCKVDVEGYELEAVRGLTRSIPLLSLELNREFLPEIRLALDHLAQFGAIEVNFSIAETHRFALEKWADKTLLFEWIERHRDPLLWGDVYVRRAGHG